MTALPLNSSTARCEEEKNAVREQLGRILEHAAFRNSVRSARFLRYVVEYWLLNDNNGEPLKERTLGAELFGLDPAYDTNRHPVVRNAAGDVRKRLTHYYFELGHESELRIEIPTGSYMPCIYFPTRAQAADKTATEEPETTREAEGVATVERVFPVLVPPMRLFWQRNRRVLLLFISLVIVTGTCVLAWPHIVSGPYRMVEISEINHFWNPVLNDSPPESTILVFEEQSLVKAGASQDLMPIGDAMALVDFARLLGNKEKRFRVSGANSITAEDMQSATVILVGGIGNPWTSHVIDGLRFHFSSQVGSDSKQTVWIEDRKNPSRRDWFLSASTPASGAVQEYAIVARVRDSRTGRWRVVAGGLEEIGTGVAARFLVDANYMEELIKRLPKGWTSMNIEAVIAVQVIDGRVGVPHLVAYEVW